MQFSTLFFPSDNKSKPHYSFYYESIFSFFLSFSWLSLLLSLLLLLRISIQGFWISFKNVCNFQPFNRSFRDLITYTQLVNKIMKTSDIISKVCCVHLFMLLCVDFCVTVCYIALMMIIKMSKLAPSVCNVELVKNIANYLLLAIFTDKRIYHYEGKRTFNFFFNEFMDMRLSLLSVGTKIERIYIKHEK